jgi:hypothetical protein
MTTSQAAEHAELIPGRWYWVSKANGSWHPALHNPMSAGGWTNEDTWEDFDGAIIQWRLIPLPSDHDARAALAQPEPVGPSMPAAISDMPEQQQRWYVLGWQAALARWGRPAITPIPVSERLPKPEDCDAEGQVWAWRVYDPGDDDQGDFWGLIPIEWLGKWPAWTHWLDDDQGDFWGLIPIEWLGKWPAWTHWLPATALPLPGQPATDA